MILSLVAIAMLQARIGPSTGAESEPAPPPSALHRHQGLLLRADLGFGRTTVKGGDQYPDLPGYVGKTDLHVGYALGEHLILAVHALDAVQPLAHFDPANSRGAFTTNLFGIGPEVVLHDGGWNLSLTPAWLRLNVSGQRDGNVDFEGWGGNVGLGKEWWIGDRVSAGLWAQFYAGLLRFPSPFSSMYGGPIYGGTLGVSFTFG